MALLAVLGIVVAAGFMNGNSPHSTAAPRTRTGDTQAPALTRTFPSNDGIYRASTWNAGCTPTGVCGSASDPRGVASVRVAVYRGGSPSFVNATLGSPGATSTSWRLSLPLPADGYYTVLVRATDNLGTATTPAGQLRATFTLDATPPPAPVLTKHPDNPTTKKSAAFTFADREAGVRFRCSLDGSGFQGCDGDQQFDHLKVRNHCFSVLAVDAAANISAPTQFCWTIALDQGVTITGNASQPFYPGAAQPLNLTFANPFNFAIKINSVSITVQPATNNAGCSGTANLVLSRAFAGPVTVPASSTRSLQQLAVPAAQWPLLQMPDLATNQDACKGATFSLTYSGTATQ